MSLSINCEKLEIILNSLYSGKLDLIKEITKLIEIIRLDEYHVSIHGCKIKVSTVIVNHAKSDDLIHGWNLLESSGIPMKILSKMFFLNTVYKRNSIKESGTVEIDKSTHVNNKSPDIIVLLSLCYWCNEYNKLYEGRNFDIKFQEVKDNLPYDGVNDTLVKMLELINLKNKNIKGKTKESLVKSVIIEIQY